jgi:hypothetical protein
LSKPEPYIGCTALEEEEEEEKEEEEEEEEFWKILSGGKSVCAFQITYTS